MAPQAKRRRSNSGALENVQNSLPLADFPAIENLKLHEEFRLDDASVVLATDVHLYRVHKSLLAKNSTVFKDMFEFPTGDAGVVGDGAGVDLWDGLPLVRMVGDSDGDIYHLLMTLYDPEYFHASKPLKPRAVLSLLQLSTKYDIPIIRRKVIQHMEVFYPVYFGKWSRKAIEALQRSDTGEVRKDFEFLLLAAARQCDAKTILPTLFYECASRSLNSILKMSNIVTSEDLERIITGREQLMKLANEFGALVLDPREKCDKEFCHQMRVMVFVDWMNLDMHGPPMFPLEACARDLDDMIEPDVLESMCGPCKFNAVVNLKEFRGRIWGNLPGIFDLEGWHVLKSAQACSVW